MKRTAFAALCGVSPQMISKYAAHLVRDAAGAIDAAASLAELEGRLEESKRQAALASLGQVTPTPQRPGEVEKSAKAQKDEVELAIRRLQYARDAGDLVSVDDVDAASRQAIASLREAFANRKREMAQGVCATFGLTPEKATPLMRYLSNEFEGVLGVFAREMTAMANPVRASTAAERQREAVPA